MPTPDDGIIFVLSIILGVVANVTLTLAVGVAIYRITYWYFDRKPDLRKP
jgi:hypothetical protein